VDKVFEIHRNKVKTIANMKISTFIAAIGYRFRGGALVAVATVGAVILVLV
jgi:hypothetical protein